AFHLQQELSVRPGDLVGVMVQRSEWAIIALLGVLKAGAAFVPIETDAPPDRKKSIIDDTGAKVVIIDINSLFDAVGWNVDLFSIDAQLHQILPGELCIPDVGPDQ